MLISFAIYSPKSKVLLAPCKNLAENSGCLLSGAGYYLIGQGGKLFFLNKSGKLVFAKKIGENLCFFRRFSSRHSLYSKLGTLVIMLIL